MALRMLLAPATAALRILLAPTMAPRMLLAPATAALRVLLAPTTVLAVPPDRTSTLTAVPAHPTRRAPLTMAPLRILLAPTTVLRILRRTLQLPRTKPGTVTPNAHRTSVASVLTNGT